MATWILILAWMSRHAYAYPGGFPGNGPFGHGGGFPGNGPFGHCGGFPGSGPFGHGGGVHKQFP